MVSPVLDRRRCSSREGGFPFGRAFFVDDGVESDLLGVVVLVLGGLCSPPTGVLEQLVVCRDAVLLHTESSTPLVHPGGGVRFGIHDEAPRFDSAMPQNAKELVICRDAVLLHMAPAEADMRGVATRLFRIITR